jgi:hypothetical protein
MRQRKSTRKRLTVEPLENRLCLSSMTLGTPLTQADAATQARVSQAYGQLPLSFEANQGQTDAQVNFVSRGSGYTLFLTPAEAVLALPKSATTEGSAPGSPGDVLHMQLVGANAAPQVLGLDALPGRSNYLIGNDPSQWHTDISSYRRVAYQNVYAGVDLIYYGNQRQLEYDFVVAPGADPHAIHLAFQGAESIAVDAQGNLVLHTAGGDVIEHAPVLYQESAGLRQAVSGTYVIEGNGQVGFALGSYDPSRQLVIDPVFSLVYSTYLGGKGQTRGYAIAVDTSGNAYVTGLTTSTAFPTQAPLQSKIAGSVDVFVTELNAAGSALVYSTYLGGSGIENDSGGLLWGGITVDGVGNAYVTGFTSSTNFPVTPGAFQTALAGRNNAFVTKINPSQVGSASLVYSTYLGGSGDDYGNGIAVDSTGDAYVVGATYSTNFPTTAGAFQVTGNNNDAFVTKINPTGSALVYSTLLGGTSTLGSDSTEAYGIALNGSGNAYVTGFTDGSDFPTTPGAYQRTFNAFNWDEAFVTEFNLAGSALVYSTYLGGSRHDRARGIAVDGSGNAYVTGWTQSTDFPTAYAF